MTYAYPSVRPDVAVNYRAAHLGRAWSRSPAGNPKRVTPTDTGIVNGHPEYRRALEYLVGGMPHLRLVASVDSLASIETCSTIPELLIIDFPYHKPGVLPTITRLAKKTRIIAVCGQPDVNLAVDHGVRDLVEDRIEEVVRGIEAVTEGKTYISHNLAMVAVQMLRTHTPDKLTPREREALSRIAQGHTHAQAARSMGVTVNTFNTYIRRIRHKLGGGNKADLTRMAIELELDA